MEYKWQCTKCGGTIEGSDKTYLSFCRKHPKANSCNVVLVDEADKVIATSLSDAQHKGIFPKPYSKKLKEEIVKEVKSEVKEEEKGKEEERGRIPADDQPLLTGYFKTQKVELHPKVQMYHQLFIEEEMVPPKTTLGEFILGAIETLLEMTGRRLAIVQVKKEE